MIADGETGVNAPGHRAHDCRRERCAPERRQHAHRLCRAEAQKERVECAHHGIARERLIPHGYGKTQPKTVTKRIEKQYPQFHEGDVLTEEFISNLSDEDKAAADQINRRTEFQVITNVY